jgi:malate synthase
MMTKGVRVTGDLGGRRAASLNDETLLFLKLLHERFEGERQILLRRRADLAARLRDGLKPGQPADSEWVRLADWRVPPPPYDLLDRRVEITGPTDAKMMINALNSGAKVFMADLEDSLSPTWDNVIDGQVNLRDAVDRRLEHTSADGKTYRLRPDIATLVVRPRGWHLPEAHVTIEGRAISASLFDFGVFFYHNARVLHARGSGPLFYLPKLENRLEARLWNDVFLFAQKYVGLPVGTVRATVLIETCLAAYEMEEILYELREHASGLNAGRWDYLFSMIKKFALQDPVFPDRAQLTMTVPFMRAYTRRLVDVCHRRGAHAIGGMAAFIPSRRDPEINERALDKVKEDKIREAGDGFDGTWVAHPDLVPVAMEVFNSVLGGKPDQKSARPPEVPRAEELRPAPVESGRITHTGITNNISVALQYLNAWLQGTGAVAIFNLMEDAATAEIARAELWQWIKRRARDADGRVIDKEYYTQAADKTVADLGGAAQGRLADARALLDHLVLGEDFIEFLTLPAYELLERKSSPKEHP